MGDAIECAGGKNPASVQTYWQPERASAQARVSQDPPDEKQCREHRGYRGRISKSRERMDDRI